MKPLVPFVIAGLIAALPAFSAPKNQYSVECMPSDAASSVVKLLKVERNGPTFRVHGTSAWGEPLHEIPVLQVSFASDDSYAQLLLDGNPRHSVSLVIQANNAQVRGALLHQGSEVNFASKTAVEFLDCK